MNSSRECLSLVIPCYNEENTLAACVESCLGLSEHGQIGRAHV